MQSNHCRATAAAARLVGLEPHLVLVMRDREIDTEVGLAGNLLVERLLGSQLHLCAASDYLRYGGDLGAMDQINAAAAAQLTAEGRRPFVIPVGGTTPTGTWGYIEAVHELCAQIQPRPPPAPAALPHFDHVIVAAGSGGTAVGLALGCRLSPLSATLHAVNVQHKPEAYYELIDKEAALLGATSELGAISATRSLHLIPPSPPPPPPPSTPPPPSPSPSPSP